MEFILIDWIGKFQFPTGWNSTQAGWCRSELPYKVSIPNGMEFYKRQEVL